MSPVAAIDCGTNSIRLLIADVATVDGAARLRDVHREMRIVRLGQGVDATGMLAPGALERTRAALHDYAALIGYHGAVVTRMVATSATRDATNRDEFFAMTEDVLGVTAEVITGDEEASLSFAGALADGTGGDGACLVVDVGGGSTELVLGDGAGVHAARSVDVGSVRLTERCLRSDPPTSAEIGDAHRLAAEVLLPAFDDVPVEGAGTLVGVAGTVTTLSAVHMGLLEYEPERIHGSTMSLEQVRSTADRLLGMSHDERTGIGSIHPGRVDVIGGGAVVVCEVAEQLCARAGITEMRVSEHDILDGIAISLAG